MVGPITRVVIVDSHPVVRFGLVAIFRAQPDVEVVGMAADGVQALKLILAERPDVVILDVILPQLNGLDVMQQARLHAAPCRFLVLTDSAADEHLNAALAAGAQGYMLKEAEPAELLSAVQALARGGAVLAPHLAARLLWRVSHGSEAELLSAREQDVLHLLVEGASNKTIASKLTVSENTVRSHVSHIMQKLQAQSRTEAAAIALRRGLVSLRFTTSPAAHSS